MFWKWFNDLFGRFWRWLEYNEYRPRPEPEPKKKPSIMDIDSDVAD
jgi:hypothetical protein